MRVARPGHGRFRLTRGVLFNLAGVAVPALLGLLTLPLIAAELGPERLGLLSLAWALVGYLAVLNLGVGRALARSTATGREARVLASIARTGAWLTLVLGTAAGIALFLAAPLLARLLRLPPALEGEAGTVFRLLAFALPWTVGTPSLVGVLEARGRFGQVNAVAAVVSAASYLGPVLVLRGGLGLIAVVVVVVMARLLGWLAYLRLCLRALPELRGAGRAARADTREILRFGGWSTVSGLVSPVMSYMDRFALAALVSAAGVAYYAAPQEVVLRVGAVSGAVVSVLFPAFAAAREGVGRSRLVRRGVTAMGVLVLPITLLLAAFAEPALRYWLGAEYAQGGARALVWLALGLLFNGLAKVPSAMIQAGGRPDLTARLHLLQLPLYLGALLGLVAWRGVEGAAMAWALRTAGDAGALYLLSVRMTPEVRGAAWRAAGVAAVAVGAVGVATLLPSAGMRAAWVLAVSASAVLVGGRQLLRPPA